MKLFQKLKDWKASGFRLSDKTKYRLQGGAVGGAVASVLLICSALAIGACSQNANEAKAEQSTRLAPVTLGEAQPRNAVNSIVPNQVYVIDENLAFPTNEYTHYDTIPVSFVSNGVTFETIKAYCSPSANIYKAFYGLGGVADAYPVYDSGWSSPLYRYVSFPNGWPELSSYTARQKTGRLWWLSQMTAYVEPSSSVASSSEDSTEDLPVGSIDEGISVRLNDDLSFSTWVKNPTNGVVASSYDGTAPFILYSNTPTDVLALASQYLTFDVGEFYVYGNEGVTFDTIGITTTAFLGDETFTLGGDSLGIVTSAMVQKGAFYIANVRYYNSVTHDTLWVKKEGITRLESNGETYTPLTGAQWLNPAYRNLVFVEPNENIVINGYEASVAWWVQNNALDASASISQFVLGNASTGVFGLIGNAFVSIASIMGIAVVPGLTIGTLMFIPLVVLLIMTIIKMVGK